MDGTRHTADEIWEDGLASKGKSNCRHLGCSFPRSQLQIFLERKRAMLNSQKRNLISSIPPSLRCYLLQAPSSQKTSLAYLHTTLILLTCGPNCVQLSTCPFSQLISSKWLVLVHLVSVQMVATYDFISTSQVPICTQYIQNYQGEKVDKRRGNVLIQPFFNAVTFKLFPHPAATLLQPSMMSKVVGAEVVGDFVFGEAAAVVPDWRLLVLLES